jgi:hypothetical protein
MIKRGITANRVNKPINIRKPQIISNVPVKCAQKVGLLNPIFVNRPTPTSSGNKNFCSPSEKNINPTARRHKSVGIDDVFKSFIIEPVDLIIIDTGSDMLNLNLLNNPM